MNNDNKIGWQFDNSYLSLPENLYTSIAPATVANPQTVVINNDLASELGLNFNKISEKQLAGIFSGNKLPDGAEPIAQAYAGHQFGHFTKLGDGRAHLLGEHITPQGKRFDIQLKGSGKTPYGRGGDGKAALGPMLREYIISEAMHALNIATTRSLAVVTTGEPVMRETALPGAILTRVASSHIRIGTFEYLAANEDIKGLQLLADYAIERHYPDLAKSDQPYLDLIAKVMQQHIILVLDWLRVGFIHGVMNTDNMTISGETIDYGPCAFMDSYDPQTVFSSIDRMGRYAYANQPHIAQWNIARLAEAILPLLHDDMKQGFKLAEKLIASFNIKFQKAWLDMMRRKLGLFDQDKQDEKLIGELLKWLQQNHADYTNFFRDLICETMPEEKIYQNGEFKNWWQKWHARRSQQQHSITESLELMQNNNPRIIPRNHLVEAALSAAEDNGDLSKLNNLLEALKEPYEDNKGFSDYYLPPPPDQRVYQTFCGT